MARMHRGEVTSVKLPRRVWVPAAFDAHRWEGYLRSAVDAQGAHPIHPNVRHVHALASDLNAAALEVLLVVHAHLGSRV